MALVLFSRKKAAPRQGDADRTPFIPYGSAFYGKPGCVFVAQTAVLPGLYRVGLTTAKRPEARIEALRDETGSAWELVWWKWSDDCGRAKQRAYKALDAFRSADEDFAMFDAGLAEIKRVVKAAADGETPAPLSRAQQQVQPTSSLQFTMFRARADGNWYWALFASDARTLARGGPFPTRTACVSSIGDVQTGAAHATMVERGVNESLSWLRAAS